MCWEKSIFSLKRVDRIITKINNEIIVIVEKIEDNLYKCEDQRLINLPDQRKSIKEGKEIIPVITGEV